MNTWIAGLGEKRQKGKLEGESSSRHLCIVEYCCVLLTAYAVGGEGKVAQPGLSIGGMLGCDRWRRGDGASPQSSVGGFVTHCAAPVLYFSRQECGPTDIKHSGDVCRMSSDKDCPLTLSHTHIFSLCFFHHSFTSSPFPLLFFLLITLM